MLQVWADNLPTAGGLVGGIGSTLYNGLFGVAAGGVIVGVYLGVKRLLPNRADAH
jgi:hypothetical protein